MVSYSVSLHTTYLLKVRVQSSLLGFCKPHPGIEHVEFSVELSHDHVSKNPHASQPRGEVDPHEPTQTLGGAPCRQLQQRESPLASALNFSVALCVVTVTVSIALYLEHIVLARECEVFFIKSEGDLRQGVNLAAVKHVLHTNTNNGYTSFKL